ncbi:hypothetical protein [Pseudomonas gingeri]|uniref:hypothetical protein n=1 Tax=Pseudomonas gingeri TaxID=117681 RepID=UPI0015A341AD|nr:hypothetical protein [Pseudomonas gingeri]NWE47203.1 hypothetical protein [Pseudomonas gingeri]
MIFGPDPSVIFLVFLLIALAALSAAGLLWVLVASLFAPTRDHLRRNPRRYAMLILVALVFAGLGGLMWRDFQRIDEEAESQRQALNPRLQADLQLGELHFPAGSQAHIGTLEALDWQGQPQAHGLQSLTSIELLGAVDVLGLPVVALDFSWGSDNARIRLEHDRMVQGWSCAASAWVVFGHAVDDRFRPSRWHFKECALVPGMGVAGVDWPAGTVVSGDRSGWMLRAEDADNLSIALDGLQLATLRMMLDAQRQPLGWQGQLAQPATLGDWRYVAGTRVRGDAGGAWLFSPSRAQDAVNLRTGEKVSLGHSILQRRGNEDSVSIKANAEVGVIDWLEITP